MGSVMTVCSSNQNRQRWLPCAAPSGVTIILLLGCLTASATALDDPLPPRIQRLAEQLVHENVDLRDQAMEQLGELGQSSQLARSVLIKAMQHSDPLIRELGLRGLGHSGSAAKDALPAVLEVLNSDARPTNRHVAVKVLGQIGPAADQAVERLIEIARGGRGEGGLLPFLSTNRWQPPRRNHIIRTDAIFALGEIGSPDGVEFLVGVLRGSEAWINRGGLPYYLNAAEALGKIGDDRPRVLQALQRGTSLKIGGTNQDRVRETADTALRQIQQRQAER